MEIDPYQIDEYDSDVSFSGSFDYDEDSAVLDPGESVPLHLSLTPHWMSSISVSLKIDVDVLGSNFSESNLDVTLTATGVRSFIRGDVNGDGVCNVADYPFLSRYLLQNGPAPGCMEAADVNGDGRVRMDDVVYLAQAVHGSGPNPGAPYYPHVASTRIRTPVSAASGAVANRILFGHPQASTKAVGALGVLLCRRRRKVAGPCHSCGTRRQ